MKENVAVPILTGRRMEFTEQDLTTDMRANRWKCINYYHYDIYVYT